MHFKEKARRHGGAEARRRNRFANGARASAVIAGLAITGCQATHVTEPLPAGWAANDAHARTEFWYQLASRPVATNDEVFHALLIYLDNADPSPDYAARVSTLRARRMVPDGFHGAADEAADRGTLAVALVRALHIRGGLTMRLTGDTPRYAVRALEYRGIYPTSSPNQCLSGGALVGIMQRAEEYEHGSPADAPAAKLPSEILRPGGPLAAVASKLNPPPAASETTFASNLPTDAFDLSLFTPPRLAIYLDDADLDSADAAGVADGLAASPRFLADEFSAPSDAVPPPAAPAGARHLNVIVTGVEGDAAEVRKSEKDPWTRAKAGMVLHEAAEFRTGAKSSVRFIIPPDQTFSLDSQGSTKVVEAVANGKKLKTDITLAHGRVRYDVAAIPPDAAAGEPIRIEQAGLEHDAAIRSPNSALALRGTKVSLFEQPEFDPEAISLTGRATYVNTFGRRVPFGGKQRASVSGSRSSAAQQASERASALLLGDLARTEFENREVSVVIQRGGFVRGDVVVGNLHLSDFATLPGSLDFVLQWTGGAQATLNDLNLAVFSPLNSRTSPDFVANPPFVVSLTPGSPSSVKTRATSYPQSSRSGGTISKNSVGPDGLELASWGKNYPVGTYRVVVFNLLDAKPAPTTVTNPVTYTIDVFLNGRKLINTVTGSVGFLQTSSAVGVAVPASTAAAVVPAAVPKKPAASKVVKPAPKARKS